MKLNCCCLIASLAAALSSGAAEKKIVLIAGSPSHGHLEHEYRAGSLLWQRCLTGVPGVNVVVVSNDWPKDEKVLDGADAVVMFVTGGGGHPAVRDDHLQKLDALMQKGAGFGTVHYGVEVEKDKGGPEFLRWQGGYFETFWSVNPHWDANFTSFPNHPITRGVKPFKIRDEWYYHMRFVDDMKGVTPILSAVPPESTRGKPGINDPHGGNPEVQKHKGEVETVMWAYDRPNGGRGFGFTGAHFHKNWADENFRKVVLNAILWIAKVDVPRNGVECSVIAEDLEQNLDPKGQKPKPQTNPAKIEPFVSPTLPGK
jgi:type 1 glutamine amidotransferase